MSDKYLKYKNKYLKLKQEKNQLSGGFSERVFYEHDVYLKSNELVSKIYKKYGEKILSLLQNVAVQGIKYLISNNVLEEYKNIYSKKRQGKVFISGLISEKYINNLNNNTDINSWVNTYLVNIRSTLTFLDLFVKLLESKSKRIGALVNQFDNLVRFRISDDNKDQINLTNIKVPYNLINNNDKTKNYNDIDMVELFEPYSEYEGYEEPIQKIVSVGSILFGEKNSNDTIGVFAAGTSGHTFDTLFLFLTFFIGTNDQKRLNLVCMACLIWMINFYHHSFREICLPLAIFSDDIELISNINYLFTFRSNNLKKNLECFEFVTNILTTKTGNPENINTSITNDFGLKNMNAIIKNENTENLDNTINFIYEKINTFRKNNNEKIGMNIPTPYKSS
jgi:hypothetical protein